MTKTQPKKAFRFAPKVVAFQQGKSRIVPLSAFIGTLAGLALFILGLWVLFFQSDNNIAIDLNAVSTTKDGRLELQGLTYRGKTESGDPFEVVAQKASEDAENPQIVNLTIVDGEIISQENGVITIDSHNGRFHQSENIITLKGDVVITQSARNLILQTEHLTGDLNKGDFDAPEKVDVTSPNSLITGQAMSVRNFGDRIIFKGQSKAIIGEDQ